MRQSRDSMPSVDKREFADAVCSRLGDYASYAGDVLYSSLDTLCPGTYYFMGINPGGDRNGLPIRETVHTISEARSNEYCTGRWQSRSKTYEPGAAPLQKRARQLFRELYHDDSRDPILDVLCTNLIFRTTPDAKELNPHDVESCWSVHEYMLDIVKPKMIITHGGWPFRVLKDKLGLHGPKEQDAGYGNWKLRCAYAKKRDATWRSRVIVVGLPHLSRYSPWSGGRQERVRNFFKAAGESAGLSIAMR